MTADGPAEFRSRGFLHRNIGYCIHKSFEFMGSRHPSQSRAGREFVDMMIKHEAQTALVKDPVRTTQ